MKRSVLVLLLLVFCHGAFVRADSPNSYAKHYIVDKAKNCGDLKYGKDPEKIKACIFEKLTNIENFYTWFWFQSGTTMPATGLILKDGELSITWYDTIGKGKETYFLNHICEDWNLDLTAKKPIQCTLKKTNQKIYLFEMESFVELIFIP